MITRRTTLKLAALSTLGLLLPRPAFAAVPAPATARTLEATPAAAPTSSSQGNRSQRAAPRPFPYAQPYRLTSQSQLSQDFFSTTEILLAETDEVFPFTVAGGAPAALVRSGGAVSLVAPDPTQPSGFSYRPVTLPQPQYPYSIPGLFSTTLKSLAVGTDAAGKTYVLAGWAYAGLLKYPEHSLDTVFVWGEIIDGSVTKIGELDTWIGWGLPYPYQLPDIPPRVVFSGTGTVRFSVFLDPTNYVTILPAQDDVEYRTMPYASGVQDGWVCEVDGGMYTAAVDDQGDVICADPSGTTYSGLSDTAFAPAANMGNDSKIAGFGPVATDGESTGVGLGLVIYGSDTPTPGRLLGSSIALFLLVDAHSYYLEITATYPSLSSVLVLPNTSDLQIASVTQGQLQMAIQLKGLGRYTSSMSNAVPFQGGIERVWAAQVPQPSGSTFFVERSDSSLAVLNQDAATKAWSLTPIRRAAEMVQDVSMWRTHLVVQDSNGISVPNFAVSATAATPIAIWQNNSSTVLGPGNAATLRTNALGQIVFATPAIALHTPAVTISGAGLPATVIAPDGDVHAYLAGTGSLNPAGKGSATGMLVAGTLATAMVTDPDGSTRALAPALYGGATDDGSASAAVAQTINQAMAIGIAAGNGTSPSSSQVPAHFSLTLAGGTAKYSTIPGAVGDFSIGSIYDSISGAASSLEDDFSKAKAFLDNAVGTAINTCQKIGMTAVQDSNGVTSYVVEITCIVADDVVTTIDYVVADVKTALAAVSAIMKTIGAEIEDVIKWIRALLGGLILDAWNAAVQLDGYLNQTPARVQKILTSTTATVTKDLTAFGKQVDSAFDTLTEKIGAQTPAAVATGSIPDGPFAGAAADVTGKLLSGCQVSWLLSKLLDSVVDVQFTVAAAFEKELIAAITAVGTSTLNTFTTIGQNWATTLTSFVGQDPAKIGQYALGALLQTFKQVFDLGLDLAAEAYEAVINLFVTCIQGLHDTLNTSVSSDLGYIGDVLSYLGIDVTLTVQRLLCLVLTFPAAVVTDLGADSPLGLRAAPASRFGSTAALAGPNPLADSIFQYSYAFAQVIGTMFQLTVDGISATGDDVPGFYAIIGMTCALVEQAATWPGKDGLADPAIPDYQNGRLGLGLSELYNEVIWLVGCAPIAVSMFDAVMEYAFEGDQPPGFTYFRDASFLALGGSLTVMSVLEAVDQSQRTPDPGQEIALAATEWVPTALSILANQKIVDETETVSLWVKLGLDSVLGIGDSLLLLTALD